MGFILAYFIAYSNLVVEVRFILVAFSFALAWFSVATQVVSDSMNP